MYILFYVVFGGVREEVIVNNGGYGGNQMANYPQNYKYVAAQTPVHQVQRQHQHQHHQNHYQ